MKSPFVGIAETLKPKMEDFKVFLLNQAETFENGVRAAARAAISPNGKYIRPMLVFVSAPADADEKSLVRRAAIAELVHLSTLIHDDVIDRADMRRNSETAYKKYGAKTAILLGDAIFSHMMSLAFEENSMAVLKKTADCVRTVCEGEIKQTLADRAEIVSREKYYEVAHGKTAALFELACNLGATAGTPPDGWREAAENAGKQLGIAYQIYDDICDWFMTESDAGKTLGTDLISGKQTFPLIALLEKLPAEQSESLAKNLPNEQPEKIAKLMRDFDIPEICAGEFSRRVAAAEESLSDFPAVNAGLLEFCGAMRNLKFG